LWWLSGNTLDCREEDPASIPGTGQKKNFLIS